MPVRQSPIHTRSDRLYQEMMVMTETRTNHKNNYRIILIVMLQNDQELIMIEIDEKACRAMNQKKLKNYMKR